MNDEELDILFGTEEDAIWLKVKEAREQSIKNLEESLIIEKEFLKLANRKLKHLEKQEKQEKPEKK